MSTRWVWFPATIGLLTTLAVYSCLALGATLRPTPSHDRPGQSRTVLESFSLYSYPLIADGGYGHGSSSGIGGVTFFPAYAVAIWIFTQLFPVSVGVAGAFLAAAMFGLALVVFACYLRVRAGPRGMGHDDVPPRPAVARYAMLSLALWPTAFYFCIPYAESMFLLLTALSLLAMQQRWNLLGLAFLIGLATAVRPVGVALVPCFLLHVRSRVPRWRSPDWLGLKAWLLVPLACWGLIAYMAYLSVAFGEPLAFATAQQHWTVIPVGGWTDRLVSLASLEPVWGTYLPASPYRWTRFTQASHPLISLSFANPIYLIGGVTLTLIGVQQRWLTDIELLLAAGLILIAYTTRGYEWGMLSQGRFMSVVLPVFIVAGEILARLPFAVAATLLAASGGLMLLYAVQQGGHGMVI